MPVSAIRTKIRQEFERHRYAAQLRTVDVLLFNSHQEFQVGHLPSHDSRALLGHRADHCGTGDAQFLETAHARAQVLPRGGGPEGEITEEFHPGIH